MFRPQLKIGEIYKFYFAHTKHRAELYFHESEHDVINEKLKTIIGLSSHFDNKIFTVIHNKEHPYYDWENNWYSIVGILINNKKFYFKMANRKVIMDDYGIEQVKDYDLEFPFI